MCYDYFAAFLNQVYDRACCNLNSSHLLRKSIAKGISAEGNDNTFFLFHFRILRIYCKGIVQV